MQLLTGLGGVVTAIAGGGLDDVLPVAAIITICVGFPIIFYMGRWIGVRSIKYGVICVVISAIFARVLSTLLDFALLSEGEYFLIFNEARSFESISFQIFSGSTILAAISLIGYWRGRRGRLGAYFVYFLRQVDDSAKLTIIQLAYEEAMHVNQKHKLEESTINNKVFAKQ